VPDEGGSSGEGSGNYLAHANGREEFDAGLMVDRKTMEKTESMSTRERLTSEAISEGTDTEKKKGKKKGRIIQKTKRYG
jgi:hypothetical protein